MKRIVLVFLCVLLIVAGCTTPETPGPEASLSLQSAIEENSTEAESFNEETASGEETPEENLPDNDWVLDTPESRGMDSEILNP